MPSVTRVAVTIDGVAKQVVRIKERSDGTLYLNCQVGRNFEDGEVHRAIHSLVRGLSELRQERNLPPVREADVSPGSLGEHRSQSPSGGYRSR